MFQGLVARMQKKATEKGASRELEAIAKRINDMGGVREFVEAYWRYIREPERWKRLETGNFANAGSEFMKHEVKFAAISGLHLMRLGRGGKEDVDEAHWQDRFRSVYCISSGHLAEEDGTDLFAYMSREIPDGESDGSAVLVGLGKARIARILQAEKDWQGFVDNEIRTSEPFGIRF